MSAGTGWPDGVGPLCYVPDLATLAEECGMPEAEVAEALADGEAGGWIEYVGSDGGQGLFYRLSYPQGFRP